MNGSFHVVLLSWQLHATTVTAIAKKTHVIVEGNTTLTEDLETDGIDALDGSDDDDRIVILVAAVTLYSMSNMPTA